MAGNKHIKRYKALADLQQALSEGKITSPGIIALDDESVHYDNNLKSIYPQYVINKGDFDWESFKIYNVKPEEDTPVETIFSLDKEFEYIYLDGGTISLNITSNKPWSCRYNSNYCTVSSSSSDGNKNITITTFYTESSRDINIDFYIENKKVATFPIYQYAYEDMPLTFEILEDGGIGWNPNSYDRQIKYSINGKSWQQIIAGTISVKNGDKLYFIGDNNRYSSGESSYYYFSSTCNVNIYGNIMSLINSTIFNTLNTITTTYCFYNLFYTLKVINANNLILPATTLADYCYNCMFYSCSSLTTAPELPATTLAYGCYGSMFADCISLTTAPELPATTLANYCYSSMFTDCTSLTTAPSILPAITLADYCYSYMFNCCTSLTTAPELPATTLANWCYYCMFNWCTSLTIAPELPATTLASSCYRWMFYGCTSLNYIKCLATDISASGCTSNWVNGVASSGTFVKAANMSGWSTGDSGIPSEWILYDNSNNIARPLTFEILQNGTILWRCSDSNYAKTIQWKKNNGSWNNITSTYYGSPISVSEGDIVEFRGANLSYGPVNYYNYFNSTCNFNVYGNIMSLTNYFTNFIKNNSLNNTNYVFNNLFLGAQIINAANLILPATTLTEHCYQAMFRNCTRLITTPTLSTTILSPYCYSEMFMGCTSLTTAPELSATTLAQGCYCYMFSGCSSLTSAPELPVTTLAENCYNSMFNGCTSLTTAPELPATTLASQCYAGMFMGCTSLTVAPELPATTLVYSCYRYMFQDCTSLVEAPELHVMTLVGSCYYHMFAGCTSLVEAPELLATTLADSCYYGMFRGCTGLTTAPELLSTTLVSNCYGYMFYGCTSLTQSPALPATTLTDYCYQGMFSGCTGLITAPALPATTLAENCYQNMFSGCTSLEIGPELPAITLVRYCYRGMFESCTSLRYIKILAKENISIGWTCTIENIFNNTSQTITIEVMYSSINSSPTSPYGSPKSWTNAGLPSNCQIIYYGNNLRINDNNIQYIGINQNEYDDDYSSIYCFNISQNNSINLLNGNNYTLESMSGNISFNISNINTNNDTQINIYGTPDELEIIKVYNSEITKYFAISNSLEEGNYIINEYGRQYLTIEIIENNSNQTRKSIEFWGRKSIINRTIQYSKNNGDWTDISFDYHYDYETNAYSAGTVLSVNVGDKIRLRGKNNFYGILYNGDIMGCRIRCYSIGKIYGNITSLIYGDNFIHKKLNNGLSSYTFSKIFEESKITDAENLILPTTSSSIGCFARMFKNCTLLSKPPKLKATTAYTQSYKEMFYRCISLTTAPELPATTVGYNCYEMMFFGCTSLTAAPALPAITLAERCYEDMFNSCTSLTTAPELPATTLASYCYINMFYGCTSLNYIKCLATDISVSGCTSDWVNGVASTGTFVKNPNMTGWTTDNNGIPSGWTIQDAA